jgi:hypothetical protein
MIPATILAASFAVAWGCVLFLVPRQVESIFRHRLWQIRDETQDYVFDRRLPDVPVVRNLIDTMEVLIQHSEQINMATYLAFHIVHRTKDVHRPSSFDVSGLSTEQAEIIDRTLDEFYRSVIFKAIAGSRAGALLLPIWLLRYKRQSKPFAEPSKEYRRLQNLHNTLKSRREPTNLLASVG